MKAFTAVLEPEKYVGQKNWWSKRKNKGKEEANKKKKKRKEI